MRDKSIKQRVPLPGKDYVLNLPKPYLSPSQIEMYITCPELYRRTYVLNAPRQPPNASLHEGSAMHAVIEASSLAVADRGKHMDLSEAIKALDYYFDKHGDEVSWAPGLEDGEATEVLRRNERKKSYTRCKNWVTKLFGADPGFEQMIEKLLPDPKGVEEEIDIELAGVQIKGRIDLWDDLFVTDIKTCKRRADPGQHLQLDIYQHAKQIRRGRLIYLIRDAGCTVDAACCVRTAKQLKDLGDYLAWQVGHVAKGISEEVFPGITPAQSWKCSKKWCPFYDKCYGRWH